VSYVTVVRNNVKTLQRCLESVRAQRHPKVEHIVLDGASTDGTLDLIREHAGTIDYFVSEPDDGLYYAINKAVPLARGEIICILNSDDWLEPDAAATAVRRLRGMRGKALLASAALSHFESGRTVVWEPAFVHPGCYFTCANDCHNAIYATRAVYEATGPYDTAYRIAADFKWIMTCLEVGTVFRYTRERTVNYSIGGISSDAVEHSLECVRVARERFTFLSKVEAERLYWSFFCFIASTADQVRFVGPKEYTRFLQQVLNRHADQAEFVQAIAWAAAAKLVHPCDLSAGQSKTAPAPPSPVVTAVRSALRGSPRLYSLARHVYRRVRSVEPE
jgi:glycosyltransferase involved in cell wall biosynthesis